MVLIEAVTKKTAMPTRLGGLLQTCDLDGDITIAAQKCQVNPAP
jgi:hypothetical protein